VIGSGNQEHHAAVDGAIAHLQKNGPARGELRARATASPLGFVA
jgi:hypothetical protein